jgi:V8-like Glu-specific endopeptidase
MDRRQQTAAAAERYRDTTRQRQEVKRRQKAEGTQVVDTPERVRARATRLVQAGELSPEAVVQAVVPGEAVEPHVLLERIIDASNDLQAVNFLARGSRAARTVARISYDRRGRLVPAGTASLVGPRLLLTNNHVLPDVATAEQAVAEFKAEVDLDNHTETIVAYRLDPQALFVSDEHLDYTVVAVRVEAGATSPGEEFGWNRLVAQQGKLATGEPVNVVGHPMGRLKEIAVRNNATLVLLDEFLHYATDTEPGNSGSPVFNDQWEIVALHHSGVPRTDDDGNWLERDGTRWRPEDGDGAIDWIANEGARVSVLLRHLAERPVSDAQRRLLAELGPQALPTMPELPVAAPAPAAETPARPERTAAAEAASGLAGRRPPFDGATQLLFLHGRRQEGKDPQVLRAKWAGGLARGLALAGLPSVDPLDGWFPFYGDAFAASLAAREAMAVDPAAAEADPAEALAPRDPSTRSVYESLIEEAAERAGLPPNVAAESTEHEGFGDLVGRLHKQLSWVANRSGLDEVLIAAVFRDVAAYLDRHEIRELVLDTVLATTPASGKLVLVSHSLGTVVAMDLLTRLPDQVEVVQLVTAGSPLGMDTVFKRLLSGGPRRPDRVGGWLNAWSPADAVAIGCPLRDDWGDRLTEVITDNPKDRAHSIEEYLADGRVAAAIGAALGATRP